MKKCFLILSIFLMFVVSSVMAGITGKITGKVTDAETGEPLVGANVVIEGTKIGTATALDGSFFIIKVPPGRYSIRVDMMGYGTLKKTDVVVNIDRTTIVNFKLKPQAIAGETITAIAVRPIVERDLTASKERITAKEIENSWAYTVNEAISTQSGVNINNGIRGSFGLDVAYFVDGQELRESGSNSNFTGINTTAIAEMEVLTGGYNAEYGQANSGIVNIVTKTSKDRIRGTIKYRMRPAGKYHWGRNIFSKENYDWKVMATLDYWKTHEGGAYADKTPEERLAAWKKFISGEMFDSKNLQDYDKRVQQEVEATIYGPITSKMSFLLSGRYLRGVNKYPSALDYNPEYNFQAKLDYQITSSTNLSFSGLYGGYATTGLSKTNYWSSEDSPQRARGVSRGQSPGASIQNPYEPFKYLFWIAGGRTGDGIRPPEYATTYSGQLKLTHVFSPSTYAELKASHFVFKQEMHTLKVLRLKWGGPNWQWPEEKMAPANELFVTSGYGDFRFNYNDNKNTKLEGSIVSQISPHHLVKGGAGFSYQYFRNIWHEGRSHDRIYMSDYIRPIAFHPYEGYAYLQDKIEIKGLVVNAGLRFDFYNANKKVSDDFWDPLRIDKDTPGNRGMSLISFDPNGPYAVKTPTQMALSPRLGVSFPITENTVLHFMYGHFNMRPAWMKMLADPIEKMEPPPEGVQVTAPIKEEELPIYYDYPTVYTGHQRNVGNPALEFEKMIQYEVGFDQNIADLLRLDVTLYYKDGKNLTSVGYQKSGMEDMATTSWLNTLLYPDKTNPQSISVGNMGWNMVYTNGGALDVRGLEATLETKLWRHATFKLIYNMSYANTIRYGLAAVYREFENGRKLGRDVLWGASNYDQGVVGNRNQRWNPHNTIKFISYLSTPVNFGPAINGIHPLGNWALNIFTMYTSGEKFTYHSPDDFSTEPLNRTWKPRYMTNMKLIKRFNTLGMRLEVSVDVRNVFNNKTLRLMTGKYLQDYMENGELPRHPLTNEVMEWTMYRRDTMPREIFFGLGLTF